MFSLHWEFNCQTNNISVRKHRQNLINLERNVGRKAFNEVRSLHLLCHVLNICITGCRNQRPSTCSFKFEPTTSTIRVHNWWKWWQRMGGNYFYWYSCSKFPYRLRQYGVIHSILWSLHRLVTVYFFQPVLLISGSPLRLALPQLAAQKESIMPKIRQRHILRKVDSK